VFTEASHYPAPYGSLETLLIAEVAAGVSYGIDVPYMDGLRYRGNKRDRV
jgi:hypothetical protein